MYRSMFYIKGHRIPKHTQGILTHIHYNKCQLDAYLSRDQVSVSQADPIFKADHWYFGVDPDDTIEAADYFYKIPANDVTDYEAFVSRIRDELVYVANWGVEEFDKVNEYPTLLNNSYNFHIDGRQSTEQSQFDSAFSAFKSLVGYYQSQIENAAAYDATLEENVYELYEMFHTRNTSDMQGSGINIWVMAFGDHNSDWVSLSDDPNIYKINADGSKGALVLDLKTKHDVVNNPSHLQAAINERHGYATTSYKQAFFGDPTHVDTYVPLTFETYLPDYRNTAITRINVRTGENPSSSGSNARPVEGSETAFTWNNISLARLYFDVTTEVAISTVTGDGWVDLEIGENNVGIVVTSQDGLATTTYTVTLTRTSS